MCFISNFIHIQPVAYTMSETVTLGVQSFGLLAVCVIYSYIQIHSSCPYYLWWRIDFLVHLFRQCHRPAFEMSTRRSVAVPCIRSNCYCFHSTLPVATRPDFSFCRDARKRETIFCCLVGDRMRGGERKNEQVVSHRKSRAVTLNFKNSVLTRSLSSIKHPTIRAQWALWPFFKHGAWLKSESYL